MKLKIMFALILLSFNTNSYSSGWLTEDGTARITSINIEIGLVRVQFSSGDASDIGCGNLGTGVLQDDGKNGDRQYAALLSAKVAGNPIKLYGDGCVTAWGQNWPKIKAVIIE